MANSKPQPEGIRMDLADVAEKVVELGAELAAGPIAGKAASVTFRIVSRHGKQIIAYWVNRDSSNVRESLERIRRPQDTELPPFAVVGLGRCGTHVTAQLGQMVAAASRTNKPDGQKADTRSVNPLKLFKRPGPLIYPLEPMMVVGDINEQMLAEVVDVLGSEEKSIGRKVLKIDYRPLAVGGAGNVPLFAEFFTRGLLSLPPKPLIRSDSKQDSAGPWENARTYLIDSCSAELANNPRLVFYIFSLGGGTGAGSAAELMRAQRYAIATTPIGDPQVYFTGVAIIPDDLEKNRTHLINAGRTLVQYLAELNIDLSKSADYYEAPRFNVGTAVTMGGGEVPLMPWNGLAVISNDVMGRSTSLAASHEAQRIANQYISQQIFNLAASQLPGEQPEEDKSAISERAFQTERLDPQDLLTGLVGPYAVCFSVAKSQAFLPPGEIDSLFVRALSVPSTTEVDKTSGTVVEGISILPASLAEYVAATSSLHEQAGPREDGKEGIIKESLSTLSGLDFFGRCARLLFVFTQPANGDIPGSSIERLLDLIDWLCPNLSQVRYAIIKGTTAHFTLSIYVEGTVVLCPDVQLAIRNYIRLCWGQRGASKEAFLAKYQELLSAEPPIKHEDITAWLGEREQYRANIPNFDNLVSALNQRWKKFVEDTEGLSDARRAELHTHTVESTYLTPKEVAAALRYVNYVSHFGQPPLV